VTEEQPQVRIRVSVGRTSKGLPSYDCTVELISSWEADTRLESLATIVLNESDRVESLLRAKYGREWET
jgi:hypothetical protein